MHNGVIITHIGYMIHMTFYSIQHQKCIFFQFIRIGGGQWITYFKLDIESSISRDRFSELDSECMIINQMGLVMLVSMFGDGQILYLQSSPTCGKLRMIEQPFIFLIPF